MSTEQINRIRALIVEKTGIDFPADDPVFAAIMAVQYSQAGAATRMESAAARMEAANLRAEKLLVDLTEERKRLAAIRPNDLAGMDNIPPQELPRANWSWGLLRFAGGILQMTIAFGLVWMVATHTIA